MRAFFMIFYEFLLQEFQIMITFELIFNNEKIRPHICFLCLIKRIAIRNYVQIVWKK